MKNTTLLISSIIILGFLNFAIYQKQLILKSGDIVMLQLMPIDPRSLMQGDYMALAYAVENQMTTSKIAPEKRNGKAVISVDEKSIAKFVRLYDGKSLLPNEKIIKFHYSPYHFRHFTIMPNSFFIQEGMAPYYQKAKYALFKFRGNKSYLLVGLADNEGNIINPDLETIDKK